MEEMDVPLKARKGVVGAEWVGCIRAQPLATASKCRATTPADELLLRKWKFHSPFANISRFKHGI
jgi:hypothetical protein